MTGDEAASSVPMSRVLDASTPAAELADLAYAHPELRRMIAGHPNCYDDLRAWISENPAEVDERTIGRDAPVEPEPAPGARRLPALRFGRLGRAASLALVAAALVVVGGGIAAALVVPGMISSASEADDRPAATNSGASGDPEPTVTPTATPTPPATADGVLPTSCDSLFSPSMRSTVESYGVTLQTSWTDPELWGTFQQDAIPYIANNDALSCAWLPGPGTGDFGLVTQIVHLPGAERDALVAHYTAVGFTRLDELGGVRFVWERTVDGQLVGESQFFRDELWFSTTWRTLGINGYTADMVTQVFQ